MGQDMLMDTIPQQVDTTARYLFYMHGSWLEEHGVAEENPRYGYYEYDAIVKTFLDHNFNVISENRLQPVKAKKYARSVSQQVRQLLESGVPPSSITVIGHSKGGQMTLLVASLVRNDAVKYVIMAGCGKKGTRFRQGYEKFLQKDASRVRGRILSLVDRDDQDTASCRETFERATDAIGEEKIFTTGRGHGLFYSPQDLWIDEVVGWARK